MTAEIAIVTRSAIALAADSALTIRQERVWKNSNKLFTLSDFNDIGVMIYGAGDFCGIAWETIIKQFRKKIGRNKFSTLTECTQAFKEFLNAFNPPGKDVTDLNIYSLFLNTIEDCKDEAKSYNSALSRRRHVSSYLRQSLADVEEKGLLDSSQSKEEFKDSYAQVIERLIDEEFEFHVTRAARTQIFELCYERSRRETESTYETGVVFAGFGENEILPVLQEWTIDGKIGLTTRAWLKKEQDLNSPTAPSAFVAPFGQPDMAFLFMEGMRLDYLNFVEVTLAGILKEKSDRLVKAYVPTKERLVESAAQRLDNETIVRTFLKEFANLRADEAIQPMLKVISSLPKEEMAAMAEALVEITSLRRKLDSKLESVGGPVDVALISKSDGFVWIKRKHYFSLDMNPDFMMKRAERFFGR